MFYTIARSHQRQAEVATIFLSLSLSLNNGVVALNRLKGWRTRRSGVSFRGNGSLASPHLIQISKPGEYKRPAIQRYPAQHPPRLFSRKRGRKKLCSCVLLCFTVRIILCRCNVVVGMEICPFLPGKSVSIGMLETSTRVVDDRGGWLPFENDDPVPRYATKLKDLDKRRFSFFLLSFIPRRINVGIKIK